MDIHLFIMKKSFGKRWKLIISETLINNDDVHNLKYHGIWCWKKGGFEKW